MAFSRVTGQGGTIAESIQLGQIASSYRPTLLETILSPLEALGRPQNALFSAIRAVKDESLSDLANIVPSLIPFMNYERIPQEDILGDQGTAGNLLLSLATDPFMYIGGIGTLSKSGKLSSKLSALRKTRTAIKTSISTTKDALLLAPEAKELKDLLGFYTKSLEETNKGIKGTIRGLRQITPEQAALAEKTTDLELRKKLLKGQPVKKPSRVVEVGIPYGPSKEISLPDWNKLQAKIGGLLSRITPDISTPAILPELKSRVAARWKRTFKTKADLPALQYLRELQQMHEAGAMQGTVASEMGSVLDTIKTISEKLDTTQDAVASRLLLGLEGRHIKGITDIPSAAKDILDKRVLELKDIYKKKWLDLKKQGKDPTELIDEFRTKAEGLRRSKNPLIKRLQTYKKHWDSLYPEEIELIDNLGKRFDETRAVEWAYGVNVKQLTSSEGMLSYVTRIITPEARAFKQGSPQEYRAIMRKAGMVFGFGKTRTPRYAKLGLEDLNTAIRQDYKISFDFFKTDPLDILFEREVAHVRQITKAEMAHNLVRSFRSSLDALKKLNLNTAPGQVAMKKMTKNTLSAEQFFKQKWVNLRSDSLPGELTQVRIPKTAIADFRHQLAMINNLESKEFTARLLDVVDRTVTQHFRTGLTAFFPAKMMRDAVGNFWNSSLGGGLSLKNLKNALTLHYKVGTGQKLTEVEEALWKSAIQHRIVGTMRSDEVNDLYYQWGKPAPKGQTWQQFIERPTSEVWRAVQKWRGKDIPPAKREAFNFFWGRAFNRYIDETARLSHFMTRMDKGDTAIEAMRSTQKYLFDYSDLTPIERQYFRPFFMFYTWNRKNIPLVLETFMTHPRRLEIYRQAMEVNSDDEVPDWLRGGFTFRWPGAHDILVSRIGLPPDDLVKQFAVGDVDPYVSDQVARLFEKNIISQANPIIKAIGHRITGRESYTGRPIHDMPLIEFRDSWIPSGRLMQALPTARVMRTLGDLTNENEPWGATLVKVLTGVKAYKIDPERARLDTLRRKALRSGKFRRFGIVSARQSYKEEPDVIATQKAIRRLQEKLNATK